VFSNVRVTSSVAQAAPRGNKRRRERNNLPRHPREGRRRRRERFITSQLLLARCCS
jgi:hypothetical protein